MPRISLASCYLSSLGALLVATILVPVFGYFFQTTFLGLATCLSALFILAAAGAFLQATAFILAGSVTDERYLYQFFVGQAAAGVLAAICGFTPYLIRQMLQHGGWRVVPLRPNFSVGVPHGAGAESGHTDFELINTRVHSSPGDSMLHDNEYLWSLCSSSLAFIVCTCLTLICILSYRALNQSRLFSTLLALPASSHDADEAPLTEEVVPLVSDASPNVHVETENTSVSIARSQREGETANDASKFDRGSEKPGGRGPGGDVSVSTSAATEQAKWIDKRVRVEQTNLFLTLFVTGLLFPASTAEWRPQASLVASKTGNAANVTVLALFMSGFTAQQLQLFLATCFQAGDLVSRLFTRWFKCCLLESETAKGNQLHAEAEAAASEAAGPHPLPSWIRREDEDDDNKLTEGSETRRVERQSGRDHEEGERDRLRAESANSALTVPVILRFLFVPLFIISQLATLPPSTPAVPLTASFDLNAVSGVVTLPVSFARSSPSTRLSPFPGSASPSSLVSLEESATEGGASATASNTAWGFFLRLISNDYVRLFLMLALAISNGLYATIAVLNANAAAAASARQFANAERGETEDAGRGEKGVQQRGQATEDERPRNRGAGQEEDAGESGSETPSSRQPLLKSEDRESPRPHSAVVSEDRYGKMETGLPLRRRRSAVERFCRKKKQDVAFGINLGVVAGVCAGSWFGAALQYFVPSSW
ncbi:putative transmembrane protein [Toxoplasma gondii VAND]|uniref:Putative transmembrane protein n=1 Tax=Toxoplasma gondii VAND TaxID=933077 RepID=A0A086PU61_TOXGO|nr:putative transmembrane protein [Toxoplasma gondii VAND]